MSLAVPAAPLCVPVARNLSSPQVKAFPSPPQTPLCFAMGLCSRNYLHFDCPVAGRNAGAETGGRGVCADPTAGAGAAGFPP